MPTVPDLSSTCLGVIFETGDRRSGAVYVTELTVTATHACKTVNNSFETVCQERPV